MTAPLYCAPENVGKTVMYQNLFCLFCLFADHGKADHSGNNVKQKGYIKYGLITCGIYHDVFYGSVSQCMRNLCLFSEMVNNKGSHLISGKACDCPGGKSDSVDSADIFHAVVIGKKGGNIAETTAVSCIYYEQKNQYQDHQESILSHVGDTLGNNDKTGSNNGENEDDLINGISVLKGVCPCGESKTSAGIKDSGNGGENSNHSHKTQTLDDHLLL